MTGAHRILLADDDVQLTRLVRGRLEAEGFEVKTCHDGGQAFQQALAWAPHVVILDHFMPHRTGRQVCEEMRALGMSTRVILCTSASDVDFRVAGLEAGADDYVCKPFAEEELVARVRAQLRRTAPGAIPKNAAQALIARLQAKDPDAVGAIRAAGRGLRFQLLGDFRIEWCGVELSGVLWNRRKPLTLLKALLLEYDRKVPFEILADRLWPDADAEVGRRNLRVTVQRVRSALDVFGEERLETVEGCYRLRLTSDDDLDLRSLDRWILEAKNRLRDKADPTESLRHLMECYPEDLLTDEPYAEWAEMARTRCRSSVMDVLRRGAAVLRAQGAMEAAGNVSRKLEELEDV